MKFDGRPGHTDATDEKTLAARRQQGNLLLQFSVIASGRVPNVTEDMQLAAAGIVEEVLDAAGMSGPLAMRFPEDAQLSAVSISAFLEWLDAACAAAGFEVVEEIFYRPKQRQLQ